MGICTILLFLASVYNASAVLAVGEQLEWNCLGPFLTGTRELGYDPLSAFGMKLKSLLKGGFESLQYSNVSCYPSEIADFGCVKWFKVLAQNHKVNVPLLNVNWEFNRKFFGWAVYETINFFKTTVNIPSTGYYAIKFDNVFHFKIDNQVYTGNGLNTTVNVPNIIYLTQGDHELYTSLEYDIRKSGGNDLPSVSFSYEIYSTDLDGYGVLLFPDQDIMPEIMGGKLVTEFASITILNSNIGNSSIEFRQEEKNHSFYHKLYDPPGWIHLIHVSAETELGIQIPTANTLGFSVKIAPGQVYNIGIQLFPRLEIDLKGLRFTLEFYYLSTKERFIIKTQLYNLVERVWNDPYKMTFVDYDGTVQYAMLRPPKNVSCIRSELVGCPVVVALHGAGVEASSPFWLNAYNQQNFAWMLFPSGRTPWGHDWHGTSHLNVRSALKNMVKMSGVPSQYMNGVRPDIARIIYSGHSNGGQGAWWMASHFPDEVIAAIPVSGFVNIQFYVPYFMAMGNSYSDPMLRGLLESSISEHNIDLYISNLAGIPVFARAGALDDNVPAVHTRRLVRLVHEWNRNPESITYDEVPGKGHWFDGILSDHLIQNFLDTFLDKRINPNLDMPPFPDSFTLTTMNPFSTGTKGGIRILQLEVPFMLAKIRVIREGSKWNLLTNNVRRLGFHHDPRQGNLTSFSIDGTDFDKSPQSAGPSYLKTGRLWAEAPDLLWISKERHPNTYGPAIHILNHPFIIVVPSHKFANISVYHHMARQIALSWYICCKGTTQIVKDVDLLDGYAAKYILGGPIDNMYTRRRAREGGSTMFQYLASGGVKLENQIYERPGTGNTTQLIKGVIFLAPSPTRTRTGLFITGIDRIGLERAAWLIPFRTGIAIPDYMVIGEDFGDSHTGWSTGKGGDYWGAGTKGSGGIYAAGFWNNTWDFDSRCGYVK